MPKTDRKRVVKIAEDEVRKFVKEWKKDPYLWDTEADIHGELYVRIKKALKDLKKIEGKYGKYMCNNARFDRVYCKPLTYVERGLNYYPDIVIYKDYKFDSSDKRINEPMLWACEIKYKTQWGGDQAEENREYDEKKLKNLFNQRNKAIRGTQHAVCLNFTRSRNKKPYYKRVDIDKKK